MSGSFVSEPKFLPIQQIDIETFHWITLICAHHGTTPLEIRWSPKSLGFQMCFIPSRHWILSISPSNICRDISVWTKVNRLALPQCGSSVVPTDRPFLPGKQPCRPTFITQLFHKKFVVSSISQYNPDDIMKGYFLRLDKVPPELQKTFYSFFRFIGWALRCSAWWLNWSWCVKLMEFPLTVYKTVWSTGKNEMLIF